MNIQELINELSKFPLETRVIIHGYDGGANDVGHVIQVPIQLNQHTEWYYGKHEIVEEGESKDELAVIIVRE